MVFSTTARREGDRLGFEFLPRGHVPGDFLLHLGGEHRDGDDPGVQVGVELRGDWPAPEHLHGDAVQVRVSGGGNQCHECGFDIGSIRAAGERERGERCLALGEDQVAV